MQSEFPKTGDKVWFFSPNFSQLNNIQVGTGIIEKVLYIACSGHIEALVKVDDEDIYVIENVIDLYDSYEALREWFINHFAEREAADSEHVKRILNEYEIKRESEGDKKP